VCVDSDGYSVEAFADGGGDVVDFVGETSAVGFAEDDGFCTGVCDSVEDLQSIVRVCFESVKEVFGVEDDFFADGDKVFDGFGADGEVVIERTSKNVCNVEVPCFADEGDGGDAGIGKRFDGEILADARVYPPCAAEGDGCCVFEVHLRYSFEEFGFLRVACGESAFDVVHAEFIEFFDDEKFVFEGEGDTFCLHTVA